MFIPQLIVYINLLLPGRLGRRKENEIHMSVRRGGDVSRRHVVFKEDDIEFLNNPVNEKKGIFILKLMETMEKLCV